MRVTSAARHQREERTKNTLLPSDRRSAWVRGSRTVGQRSEDSADDLTRKHLARRDGGVPPELEVVGEG
jgi:hypothetical protein